MERETRFTPRQGQVLAFIHAYTLRHGVSPSFEEIAAHLGTTPPSVNGMIKTLERKGLLSRIPGKARTLRVEVPAALLPAGDYAASSPRRSATSAGTAPAQASDVAAAAVLAVLDRLHPFLRDAGVDDSDAVRWLASTIPQIREALVRSGCSPDRAAEAARLIGAHAARWWPQAKGVAIPRRRWAPRDRGR